MKHLQKFDAVFNAQEEARKLRSFGILTYISNEHSRTHSFITGAFSVDLWVVLDKQYHDAKELLQNEHHVVEEPLSEEEMRKIETESTKFLSNEITHGITANIVIIPTIIVLIALVVYIKSVW